MSSFTSQPPIATARLWLRPLGVDDAEALRVLTNEPAIIDAIDFLSAPFTIEDARRLIAADGDGRDGFWGVWLRDAPTLIGAIGTHLRGAAAIEVGYWFADAARKRGFATEAVGAVVERLAGVFRDQEIFAECRPDNAASWTLLERTGFRADGRDGNRTGRKRLVFARSA